MGAATSLGDLTWRTSGFRTCQPLRPPMLELPFHPLEEGLAKASGWCVVQAEIVERALLSAKTGQADRGDTIVLVEHHRCVWYAAWDRSIIMELVQKSKRCAVGGGCG
mmetsp:Transcript_58389/g.136489  ORF Transcript_58389/g.136489 Transcript_58389/m.136489 type:complete len:108 (+) Transcript_58389:415-738(+)